MGCFKEIYTEQMESLHDSQMIFSSEFHPLLSNEKLRLEVSSEDLEIILADEKDEYTLSFLPPSDLSLTQQLAIHLLS